jgi:hypothetical protein
MDDTPFLDRVLSRTRLLVPLILLQFSACSGGPPALTIGDVEYTETDLLAFNGDRRTRLAEITAVGLAVARGEGSRLGDPLIARRGNEALLEALERELALQFAGVDEESLEARYQADPDYQLSVRHLVLMVEEWASEEEEAEARAKADAALDRVLGGEDFAQVAGEVSEEPGAGERGGLLQPGRKGTWVEEFWNAANGLEVGGVSPVIRTQYGFHVLKLEGQTPLPFLQGRNRVVEDILRALPHESVALAAWIDSVTVTLSVDSAALTAAWEEAGSLFVLADRTLREGDPQGVLAHWDGGEFTRSELRDFLLSLERPGWEALSEGGLEELIRTATEAARRSLLTGLADSMGVVPPDGTEEVFRTMWDQAIQGWARGLGFQEGMSTDQVRLVALAAVGSTAQGARLAREEIRKWAPLLLSAYPIGPELD